MMEIIVGGKATGKTHLLIRAAIDEFNRGGRPLIFVADSDAQQQTVTKVYQMLVEDGRPPERARVIARALVRNARRGTAGANAKIYVDDLDAVMRVLLGAPVDMSTSASLVQTPQGKRFYTQEANPHVR